MPHSQIARSLRLAPLAVALGLLAACATIGGSGKTPASVAALYAQLDQASKGYETALQQARANDTEAAEKTLAQALDQLRDASARCGSTPGCDPQRFFSVFDRLLRLKDGSFIGDESPDDQDDESPSGQVAGLNGAASLPQAQRSVTLLHGQKLSELIAMNGPVKAALEMWLTQWRSNLMDAYVNYQYLRHEMWPAYQKADLPEALLFGILAKESGGKVHAVSRSGAAGPLQFMYATGMRFGLGTVDGFDTRFDPAAAARANAEYVDEQLKAFNDNLELTLAAYNGGEGRMRRLVNGDTSVSFYDPRIYDQLSQETRDYVPSVLAAAWLFLHPDSYNLRFPKIDGAPGSITLKRPASLSELTVCLGEADGMQDGWFRTLRNLNPRLDPQQEQPTGAVLQVPKPLESAYASRCVSGPWPILASDLHNAVVPVVPVRHDPPPSSSSRYTVRRGDTISSIARRHGCSSANEVERLNGIRHHQIRVGQVLKLPSSCR
ncbi:transglycosylase SLT domain-containing protein [Fulvimonas sp. R45]|uniref:transglycosylase SLT domain-containing protein n=1 Tax=Fulvimonas sp. R45 TaxID=3045937 RepID=UPI00265EB899|nr:transglycosylase SLT domain-containing protein [Fulvimonas sp. R45]MDO1530588.1 transglycosylase SLT domain-containing protein [Fulvimonas sp. R45]